MTKKGFTLVELLIVIIIIGILATIAVPQYSKIVEKSKWSQAQSTLGALARAQKIYYAEYGGYYEWGPGGSFTHQTLAGLMIDLANNGPLPGQSVDSFGDKSFSYSCHPGYSDPEAPYGTVGVSWACMAYPFGWTPSAGNRMIYDLIENKIKLHKSDGTWVDYP